MATNCLLSVNGVQRQASAIVKSSLRIVDILNEAPNTCEFIARTFTPVEGQEVKVGLGSLATADLIFGGVIRKIEQMYLAGNKANVAWLVSCQDYTVLLNRRKVWKRYTATSATTIAQNLISTYTSGFTSTNVAASLASVSIDFEGEDVGACLTRLASAIGGYWYIDYAKDLHFFITEAASAPDTLVAGLASLRADPPVTYATDLHQIRTRIYLTGASTRLEVGANNVLAAGATRVPVDDQTPWTAAANFVSGPQVVAVSGVSADANKATTSVGIAKAPGTPSATLNSVSGNVAPGSYQYKFTFVNTNGDESEPGSASSAVAVTNISAPSSAPSVSGVTAANGAIPNGSYEWQVQHIDAKGGHTTVVGTSGSLSGANNAADITFVTSADARTVARRLYRKTGAGNGKLIEEIPDNVTTTYRDVKSDQELGAEAVNTNNSGSAQINVSSIAAGPTGTARRKLYRTKNGGSIYYHVATINDNSTTTFTDNVADENLGDAAPTASAWRTAAGSTTLTVSDLSQFSEGNGWLRVGNQIVSFTSRAASSGSGNLQGIPASGIGALLADVTAGTPVICLPFLKTSATTLAMNQGDPVALFVQRDDTTAQTALAALEGGDGIHEHPISDEALTTVALCNARGDAELALFKSPIKSITYASEDQKTRSGKTISVNLSSPTSIVGDFQIQRVTISQIDMASNQPPCYMVEASSSKYSLEDLLRNVQIAAA